MSDDKRKPGGRPKTRFEPVSRKETGQGGASQEPPAASRPPVKSKPPARPEAPAQTPPPPLPSLRLLEPGEAPRYAGLRRDARGIVAGPQGAVAVQGARRLAAFLAALSCVADLAHGVALEAHDEGLFLVLLTPPSAGPPPSQLYDTVQGALAAASLSITRARLYSGDGRVFVPYGDPDAPHGCDVDGAAPSHGRVLLRSGEPAVSLDERPVALLDALLAIPLQPAPRSLPTTLSVLTDRRLAAMIAGYVQHHGLAYGVRFLTWRQGDRASEVALFDIVTAGELRPVPGFVCDFLSRLPHTTLLVDALEPADLEQEPERRALIAWGHSTPLHLPHIQELLPARHLLILAGEPRGATVISAPAARTPMQRLSEAIITAPASTVVSAQPSARLQLPLELRRDRPADGPIHALLLDGAALNRLQRMVRRLPARLFAHARIALGDGVALVLAADDGELSGLPLGLPLARAEPPTLLLPRGMRLLPSLPQDLLIPALGMSPETLTILTALRRFDVAQAALQPLASLLTLRSPARTDMITVRSVALPPLDLSDLEELPKPAPAEPRTAETPTPLQEKEKRSPLEWPLGSSPADGQASGDGQTELQRLAADLEQRGDYELAAAFYTYLKDDERAAACYQRLVAHSQ